MFFSQPIAIETTSPVVVDELAKEISSLLSICNTAKTTEERKSAADELAQKVSKIAGPQKVHTTVSSGYFFLCSIPW